MKKLIRDNELLEVMTNNAGKRVTFVAVSPEALEKTLARDVAQRIPKASTVDEFADIVDLVMSLATIHGISPGEIETQQRVALEAYGGYQKGIIVSIGAEPGTYAGRKRTPRKAAKTARKRPRKVPTMDESAE